MKGSFAKQAEALSCWKLENLSPFLSDQIHIWKLQNHHSTRINLTAPLYFISASCQLPQHLQRLRLRCCKKQESEDKFSLLSVASFFFPRHFRRSQISLPPTSSYWSLLERAFSKAGRGTLLPSKRGESYMHRPWEAVQMKSSQLSSACSLPAESPLPNDWEKRKEKQSQALENLVQSPSCKSRANRTGSDTLRYSMFLPWKNNSIQRAPRTHSQFTPTAAESRGLTVVFVIALPANQRATESPGSLVCLVCLCKDFAYWLSSYFISEAFWDTQPQNTRSLCMEVPKGLIMR